MLTFLFVYCFLLLIITPRFCCNYANYIVLCSQTLYARLPIIYYCGVRSFTRHYSLIKIPCFTDQTTVAMSYTKQLIDTGQEGV